MPSGDELRYRALADPTRRHLLRILDDSDGDVSLAELAERVGLHVNTIRGHVDLLQQADLVERTTIPRQTPGRPRIGFRSVRREARSPGSEGYRFLADVLAAWIQLGDAPAAEAREAGRAWGRLLMEETPVSASGAVEQVTTTLAELGFAPQRTSRRSVTEIRLHDCPFRELAKTRGEVVCSIHAGLVVGMLEEMGSDLTLDELTPFVEPSLCIARISPGG